MDSTYILPGLETEDGHLHPSFGVSKTATGRLNSWNPNGQNVPEVMRDIWVPDSDDHVLVSADWSQIEWRLAMVMSGDPVGLALLASGVDNHRAVAAETLRKAIEDVTDEERYASKFIVYGLGYGRGAPSIAEGHGLDIGFVQNFIRGFFAKFRVFSQWRDRNVEFVKKNHYLANPYNRRRWWYTWQVTEVYNFPQQSTGGDMMYDAIIAVDKDLPKGASLRLTVHDELVVNTPKSCVRETIEVIKTHMEAKQQLIVDASARPDIVAEYYPDGWFCPADIHVGSDWAMCKSKDKLKKAQRAELEKHLGLVA
jgi:DNA polymerase-1